MEEKINKNTYSVYRHKNKINGKVYIGLTCQVPTSRRWGRNGNSYKSQTHFYRAIQKYGWNKFDHDVLFSNLSQKEANEIERKLIAFYDSTNQDKGYNIQYGGMANRVNEKTKKILSENHKGLMAGEKHPMYGKHHSEDSKRKISEVQYKPLFQYDRFTGNFIKRFESTLEAEKELNIPNANISAVCLKRMKTIHNFVFRYESDNVSFGKPLSNEELDWINRNDSNTPIVQYDLKGNYIKTFKSIVDATHETNTSKSSISGCLSEKNKVGGNYIWKYLSDVKEGENITIDFDVSKSFKGKKKKVFLYNSDNNFIKSFDTSKDLSEYLKVSPSMITYAMKNSNGRIKEYICKYA